MQVFAAGKGTRMKSSAKCCTEVCGKTMVEHVLGQLEEAKIDNIVRYWLWCRNVEQTLGNRTNMLCKNSSWGLVMRLCRLNRCWVIRGETLIVSGDTPLFTAATFNKMFEYHEQRHAAVTIRLQWH